MPIDAETQLLLIMNGTDGSTTFTDETGVHTVTANGDAQIDTAQSKMGGSSGLFDGTGDYLSIPDNADWQLDDGADANLWTIDLWARHNGDPGTGRRGLVQQYQSNNEFWSLWLVNNTLQWQVRTGGANTVLIAPAWNPPDATWQHVAVVKNGTAGYLHFVDGTQTGSTTTDTSTIPNFTGSLFVGRNIDGSGVTDYMNGWLQAVRISKGVARWTSSFTPPSTLADYGLGVETGNFFFLF